MANSKQIKAVDEILWVEKEQRLKIQPKKKEFLIHKHTKRSCESKKG